MSFILDTNVISELWRPQPDNQVLTWVFNNEWVIPVPVIAEIQTGIEAAPKEARRVQLNAQLDVLLTQHAGALLDWDAETSRIWGRLQHAEEVRRRPQALWDSLIDAMAVRNDLVVATRNVNDFRHSTTFDPWTGIEHPART